MYCYETRPVDQISTLVYIWVQYGQLLSYCYCHRFHEPSYIMPIVYIQWKCAPPTSLCGDFSIIGYFKFVTSCELDFVTMTGLSRASSCSFNNLVSSGSSRFFCLIIFKASLRIMSWKILKTVSTLPHHVPPGCLQTDEYCILYRNWDLYY